MIQEFVDRFMANRQEITAKLGEKHVHNYAELVKLVVASVVGDDYGQPNPEAIHEIDDGDYQGTLLYVIPANTYQPSDYWFVKVYYGSCSGCDTLQGISSYFTETPTPEQVNEYWTLCLHIVQGLKKME